MTPFTLKGHILFIFHYIVMFFTYLDTPSGGLQKKIKKSKGTNHGQESYNDPISLRVR